ncbi:MAG: hypothetical protein MI923_13390 [Phycisphaerales bacterium]|nr:hypothetical protein [Phycisphaerales bacterium]
MGKHQLTLRIRDANVLEMHRILTILLPVWALVLTPSLCFGGLLHHSCACDAEHGCEDGNNEERRGHDPDCSSDPCCGEVVPSFNRSEQSQGSQGDHEIAPCFTATIDPAHPMAEVLLLHADFDRSDGCSARLRLACHISDLPLLI